MPLYASRRSTRAGLIMPGEIIGRNQGTSLEVLTSASQEAVIPEDEALLDIIGGRILRYAVEEEEIQVDRDLNRCTQKNIKSVGEITALTRSLKLWH